MNKTTPIKDPSVMDENLSVMSETPTVMGEETTSMLQKITNTILSAISHPKETYKKYIKNKELKRKEKGIKMIMEEINMVEEHFWNYFYKHELSEFYKYFRIKYCRNYKKTKWNKEIEKEEEKKVIKNFQDRISIIRDKIFQNPQMYLAIHEMVGNPIVVWWWNYDKLIKEMFGDYLTELNAKWKEKDDLLSDIAWWLRTWFNAVLQEDYKLWTIAYIKMTKKLIYHILYQQRK